MTDSNASERPTRDAAIFLLSHLIFNVIQYNSSMLEYDAREKKCFLIIRLSFRGTRSFVIATVIEIGRVFLTFFLHFARKCNQSCFFIDRKFSKLITPIEKKTRCLHMLFPPSSSAMTGISQGNDYFYVSNFFLTF